MPSNNALAEASPDSLALLMNSDPLKLARSDRTLLVAELRRMRLKFEQDMLDGKRKGPAKAPKEKEIGETLSLDDIL